MAQTKRKRRRKHRGTQAGTIERAGRTSAGTRTRAKEDAPKKEAKTGRERRLARFDQPPTWKGAAQRAAIAAALFGLLVVVVFGRPVEGGALGAAAAFLVYVPITYYLDGFVYQRRQRRKAAGKERGGKERGGKERGGKKAVGKEPDG